MVILFHVIALMLYLAAAGLLLGSLVGARGAVPRGAAVLLPVAAVAHAVGLGAYVERFAELPLVGLGPSLSTLAFAITVFLFAISPLREARPVGLLLLPLVSVLLGMALVQGIVPAGAAISFRGPWFALHVLLAFLGYAGLAVSFAAGAMYLVQFRELKGKRFGRVFRFFPPLGTLDLLGRGGLAVGFPALTLSLVLGWAWTVRFQRTLAATNPQVIWGVLTWLVFVAALAVRSRGVARDRRGAQAAVLGFLVVVLAYVVLRMLMAGGRFFL
jgi:ABC-type transport system involved in cytochrome c biogenesis permease subunit